VTGSGDEVDATYDHDHGDHGHDDRCQPSPSCAFDTPRQLTFQLALRCLAALLVARHLPLPGVLTSSDRVTAQSRAR
jgi:hypothetical protein